MIVHSFIHSLIQIQYTTDTVVYCVNITKQPRFRAVAWQSSCLCMSDLQKQWKDFTSFSKTECRETKRKNAKKRQKILLNGCHLLSEEYLEENRAEKQ